MLYADLRVVDFLVTSLEFDVFFFANQIDQLAGFPNRKRRFDFDDERYIDEAFLAGSVSLMIDRRIDRVRIFRQIEFQSFSGDDDLGDDIVTDAERFAGFGSSRMNLAVFQQLIFRIE